MLEQNVCVNLIYVSLHDCSGPLRINGQELMGYFKWVPLLPFLLPPTALILKCARRAERSLEHKIFWHHATVGGGGEESSHSVSAANLSPLLFSSRTSCCKTSLKDSNPHPVTTFEIFCPCWKKKSHRSNPSPG